MFNQTIINIKRGAQTESNTEIFLPGVFKLSENNKKWPDDAVLCWKMAQSRPAPMMPDFTAFRGLGPCDVITHLYADACALSRILDGIGKPKDELDVEKRCIIAQRGCMQCVYAAWLCVELMANISLEQTTNNSIKIAVHLDGYKNTTTDLCGAFAKTWAGSGAVAFFEISRPFYEALNSVYSAIPVVSITQAIFRTIRGIGSEEHSMFRVYPTGENERVKAWYLSRAQGAAFLRKLITEYLIRGIGGLEPQKPVKGLKMPGPRSMDKYELAALKNHITRAIELGRLPVDVFELTDMSQHLFNPDPFTEFKFWNCRFEA